MLAFLGLTNLWRENFKRATLITALVCVSLLFPLSSVYAQEVEY